MTTVEAVRSSDRLCFQLWGTSDLMLPSLGCSLGSASLRAPLCLQESSFGSPWPVLPLFQVDCWDAVGVSACSLNSVSHCAFSQTKLQASFCQSYSSVWPLLLASCLGEGEIYSQLGIFTMEIVSALGCLCYSRGDVVDHVLIAAFPST